MNEEWTDCRLGSQTACEGNQPELVDTYGDTSDGQFSGDGNCPNAPDTPAGKIECFIADYRDGSGAEGNRFLPLECVPDSMK